MCKISYIGLSSTGRYSILNWIYECLTQSFDHLHPIKLNNRRCKIATFVFGKALHLTKQYFLSCKFGCISRGILFDNLFRKTGGKINRKLDILEKHNLFYLNQFSNKKCGSNAYQIMYGSMVT